MFYIGKFVRFALPAACDEGTGNGGMGGRRGPNVDRIKRGFCSIERDIEFLLPRIKCSCMSAAVTHISKLSTPCQGRVSGLCARCLRAPQPKIKLTRTNCIHLLGVIGMEQEFGKICNWRNCTTFKLRKAYEILWNCSSISPSASRRMSKWKWKIG
jgi:hypothetical protein